MKLYKLVGLIGIILVVLKLAGVLAMGWFWIIAMFPISFTLWLFYWIFRVIIGLMVDR